jgi:hypothetical protein
VNLYPDRFADHWWWRPGVYPDARLLVWHILFDDQPRARDLVAEYQRRLADVAGLDLVPAAWLHMTVHIAALAEDVTPIAVEEMTAAVSGRLEKLKPVETALGKPRIYREGIVLPAQPTDALADVHAEVVAGTAETLGAGHVSNEPTFVPHVSLAYANGSAPTEPAACALVPWLEPCVITITDVRLVAQQRDHHLYRWEPIAVAPTRRAGRSPLSRRRCVGWTRRLLRSSAV